MTLLSVVKDVCAAVGVEIPDSVFSGINTNRTRAEMLALAVEMAQRIAYDTRDWTALRKQAVFTGDGVADPVSLDDVFAMPADFKRMLLTANVWRSTSTTQPMRFVPDTDTWLQRRAGGWSSFAGEWTMYGGRMHIWPVMAGPVTGPPAVPAVTARFPYIDRNCVEIRSPGGALTGLGDVFMSDTDTYRLDERLLKLGMIWQWKAQKGSPYAEDMSNYQDAVMRASGADSPAPIMIGRMPISSAVGQSYPFPVDPGMVPL